MEDFPNRAEHPLNWNLEPACTEEYCGGGSGTLIPDGYRRVTTISAERPFTAVLLDKSGGIMRSQFSEYSSDGGEYVADVTWEPEVGARVPLEELGVEGAVTDFLRSEVYSIRIIPRAEKGTAPQTIRYDLSQSMVAPE